MKKIIFNLFLTTLSGVLVFFSFPPLGLWSCAVVAWIPLLFVVKSTAGLYAFFYGFLQGMIAYGLSLFWLTNIFQISAIGLFAILSIFIGVFCLLYNIAGSEIQRPVIMALFTAVCWTSIEFFRSEIFWLRFSWITPGIALGPTWLSPFIGVFGASFIVIFSSTLVVFKPTRIIGIACCILTLGIGLIDLPIINPQKKPVNVVAVQSESGLFDDYYNLSQQTSNLKPHLIVWPEYAVPYDIRSDAKDEFVRLMGLAKKLNCTFVVGTKTIIGNNVWYNTALTFEPTGIIGEYYKNRPVHFFNDGKPGKKFNPIETSFGVIGTPICFDNDYPSVVRKIVMNGAELIVAPNYDAMWWSATQHNQHSDLFCLRAAENYRWVVCAASSGMSKIIDPYGNIHEYLEISKIGTIFGQVELIKEKTFYTQFGWIFPWICLFIFIAWQAAMFFRRGQSRTKNKSNSMSADQQDIGG